jgi:hypothetical protein
MLYWNLLLTGVGVGFAHTLVARRYYELEHVEIGMRLPPMPVWLVVHEEVRTNARIRRVANFFGIGARRYLAQRLNRLPRLEPSSTSPSEKRSYGNALKVLAIGQPSASEGSG